MPLPLNPRSVVCAAALFATGWLPGAEFDLVIRAGRILDGTGAPAVAGDVAVRDGRIAAVGRFAGAGRAEIDAAGRVVAPGFIDVHTHSEDIRELPVAENFLRMGVTTIITGNCGTSARDIGAFLDGLGQAGVAVNVATLVGHGTVRFEVMGGSFARPPTAEERARMCGLVERGLDAGAVGLSTGLIYLPGVFAKTDELVELARAVSARDAIYVSHMRYENRRIREALDELMQVAREARVRVELSHIKLGGPAAWGRAAEVLAFLDGARAAGIEVTHDQYVYTASSTSLGSRIPEDMREGGAARFLERLADPARKAKCVAEMKETLALNRQPDFAYAVIASFEPDPRLNGLTVPAAAKLLRGGDTIDDQIETILDLQARGGAKAVFHGMNEDDLQAFLRHPLTMIASDGGPQKLGEAVPHPRSYGNNVRVLARYVRELGVLSLEDAVRKMTSLPAGSFRLADRGVVRAGAIADLVVFDPANVAERATYADPHRYAAGFDDVIVNGVPVIRGGELTGARPGQAVRRQGSGSPKQ